MPDSSSRYREHENLTAEIEKAPPAPKAILQLIYAECLWKHYHRNASTINRRTTVNDTKPNFLTWTESDFKDAIEKAYHATLIEKATLQKTKLSQYDPIFDYYRAENFKSKSVYDYLIEANIKHYRSNAHYPTQGQLEQIGTDKLYGDTANFLMLNPNINDDPALIRTLQLYQQREADVPTIDNQLERLSFCYERLLHNTDKMLEALERLSKLTNDTFALQKIQYQKANLYGGAASKNEHPDYNLRALQILDSILKHNNHSNTYKLAILKRNEITSKQLNVTLEKYLYEKQHSRALVQYKNIDTLKVAFYKTGVAKMKSFEYETLDRNFFVDSIIKHDKPVASFIQALPGQNDYFSHTTEVMLPELEIGCYAAYFECTKSDGDKTFVYDTFIVSNLAVTCFEPIEDVEVYQVLDRKTGKPVENATLKSHSVETKTDGSGIATIKINDDDPYDYRRVWMDLSKGADSLYIRNQDAPHRQAYDPDAGFTAKVQLFTDRSIYRPGQTVFYKGIAIQKKGIHTQVVPNLTVQVDVVDREDNSIKSVTAVTNEYGSFSGEFALPKNGLMGEFNISANEPENLEIVDGYDPVLKKHPFWDEVRFENDICSFSVEEYKRPKFEVGFEPVTQNFIFGQKATLVGKAKAFAGSVVSDAKVAYTITRQGYNYNALPKIITGETTTDGSGKFSIAFIAEMDPDDDEKLPVYAYTVKAEVTDINGETRWDSQVISIGLHTLRLGLQISSTVKTDQKNTLYLTSTNLNEEFLATNGELKIVLLREHEKQFQNRPWETPEIETITKTEFAQLFPYEKRFAEMPPETVVFTKKVNTKNEKSIALDFIKNYKSGYYKAVFTAKDPTGPEIMTSTPFEVIQTRDAFVANQIVTMTQSNNHPEKDGYVEMKFTSPVPRLYLQIAASYNSDNYFSNDIVLENHSATLRIPIQKHFEKIRIGYETIFENDHYDRDTEITFDIPKSLLEFETESFRSKIEPGMPEKWSFKLTRNSASKEVEVLASMYDASLDAFKTAHWDGLAIGQHNYNYFESKSALGFGNLYVRFYNLSKRPSFINLRNESINLMWFGFEFGNANARLSQDYQMQLDRKIARPAHSKVISGIVTESGLPVPGTIIYIKGTGRSTQSDFDGYYEIDAVKGETIIFSSLGMHQQEVVIDATTSISVELEQDDSQLGEVVVTAAGIRKEKSSLGYAVTTIKTEEFDAEEDLSVFSAISGKAPGVSVQDAALGAGAKIIIRGYSSMGNTNGALVVVDGKIMSTDDLAKIPASDLMSVSVLNKSSATALYGSAASNGVVIITTKRALADLTQVKVRKNLSETAFFYPNLKTDKKGRLSFSFTAPEALTQWKMRLYAHDKNAVSGKLTKTTVTQKDLMLLPNFPRFFREKDTIDITAKVANVTDKPLVGIASLQFFDAVTMENVDARLAHTNTVVNFDIPIGGNAPISWKIVIPEGLEGLQYKIVAQSGNFSDGEENIIPVLSNNMLVTESIPVWVRENSKKQYAFENLKNNTSSTLRNHLITLEYTSNPAWTAIQSLPYLMEYEHECAEQTFARFYANALATQIIDSNPKIAAVFDSWRKDGVADSKLEQNEELKSIILAETPWLRDAQNQAQQKKNLALLFDLDKMKQSQKATFEKLRLKQQSSGGFSWFDGGIENIYITRHIIAGFGHLKKLGIKLPEDDTEIIKNGVDYIDADFLRNHNKRIEWLKRYPSGKWVNCFNELHYLYGRSFFLDDVKRSREIDEAAQIYLGRIKAGWVDYSLYEKAMAALTMYRFGDVTTAKKILVSLRETASNNEDWGMYWIENKASYYWYQSPIETQALLIEAFGEIADDTQSVDAMKVWLLKMKQNKNWPTTKATTESVYALLLQGSDWLSVKDNTVIEIGDQKVLTKKITESEREAGTGYLKLSWKGDEITKDMANVSIQNKTNVPAYGGLYWQYFETLDKIKNNPEHALSVSKELYLNQNTTTGAQLNKITAKNQLKTGDLVTVRLVITATQDNEYVHLKGMRASCFEPVDVISKYEWKDGLGYYKSTKDAATHFFFDSIRKGTYVLEYDLRVSNTGDFSNGITTIQSMYAPEFASHTKGIRVHVK